MNTPNSNTDLIQTIAAFGGFVLGIVNLIILLYQEFWKKGKLDVSVEKADMKKIGEGFYDLQISIVLSASRKDVFLKEMKLGNESEVFGAYATQNNLILSRIYPYRRNDLLELTPEQFEQKLMQEMNPKSIIVRDLKIANNSQQSYMIVDRIESARYPDGWDDLPTDGWYLQFEYGNSVVKVPANLNFRR